MSFRNMSNRQEFEVLRNRSEKKTDEKMWHNIYPPQVALAFKNVQKFTVANWVPIVVGLVGIIGGAAGGFIFGQAFSAANVGKKFSKGAIDLLPKSIKKGLETHAGKYMNLF